MLLIYSITYIIFISFYYICVNSIVLLDLVSFLDFFAEYYFD